MAHTEIEKPKDKQSGLYVWKPMLTLLLNFFVTLSKSPTSLHFIYYSREKGQPD